MTLGALYRDPARHLLDGGGRAGVALAPSRSRAERESAAT